MGKNTDKLYITHSEWASGGHSASSGKTGAAAEAAAAPALPFWTCSISLQPVQEDAGMADADGHVFDIRNILPYIREHGRNPVTGEPLQGSQLTKLKIAKNSQGAYIDPVTFKEFRLATPAVVIRPTGRVYLKTTVQEHNLKPKFWQDLVTDEPFTKSDIIELKSGSPERKGADRAKKLAAAQQSLVKRRAEPELAKRKAEQVEEQPDEPASKAKKPSQPVSMLTSHHMSSSLTSTAFDPVTQATFLDTPIEKLLRQKKFVEPGYATIETSLGSMRVELLPKYSPKAVWNFVELSKQKFYDGLLFHRNVRNFMIQTGDGSSAGRDSHSAFPGGKPFADETNTPLRHDERGVLSMANRGKNTNTSQFYITYRRCPHLDGKHTVFGKVLSGLSVLDSMERIPVDANEVPVEPIKLVSIRVDVDPFEGGLGDKPKTKEAVDTAEDDTPWLKSSKHEDTGVGKYLAQAKSSIVSSDSAANKRAKTSISKSSFAGW